MGKAIRIVFLLVWTLGAAGMSVVFIGMGRSFLAFGAGGPGGFSVVPFLMAVVPMGFTALGVMMLVKVARSSPGAGTTPTTNEVEMPLPAVAAGACPGCGSRRNGPGALTCEHCGGRLAQG